MEPGSRRRRAGVSREALRDRARSLCRFSCSDDDFLVVEKVPDTVVFHQRADVGHYGVMCIRLSFQEALITMGLHTPSSRRRILTSRRRRNASLPVNSTSTL